MEVMDTRLSLRVLCNSAVTARLPLTSPLYLGLMKPRCSQQEETSVPAAVISKAAPATAIDLAGFTSVSRLTQRAQNAAVTQRDMSGGRSRGGGWRRGAEGKEPNVSSRWRSEERRHAWRELWAGRTLLDHLVCLSVGAFPNQSRARGPT